MLKKTQFEFFFLKSNEYILTFDTPLNARILLH